MPFLLAEILNFQGSAHLRGVGSFSHIIILEARITKLVSDFIDQIIYHIRE